ncbi:Gfo/Idh/MocA family protein [Ferroacidibacillus organovorans]|uniref:Dehydrogenase n=1 Tax=Ferroacidibacillus organovorans TaxID=1765683 RepID=A0A1V4EXT7_9BACL|nr:Gfo/Idh/MocA family oxidoreductase [Ferroacidibacillus organovorans]OPG17672.1 dehydrogenase [Ferroacidibacillus organovorans]
MTTLRVGVIGCGAIAVNRHLPEYRDNSRVKLVGVCDAKEARVQDVAKTYGIRAYTRWEDMLLEQELDAVSVCLPNRFHGPVSTAALRAGKHVLCEKPMAVSADEAEAMIAAADEAGRVLMIAHNQRFFPAHIRAKQLLHSGRLGAVLQFRTTFAHGGPEQWSAEGMQSWFFNEQDAFVGALGDLGIHKADLIRWLLEDEVVEVSAMLRTLEKAANVDDNAVCLLGMRSGAVGTLTASWTHRPGEDDTTTLYCEHGILHIDPHAEVPLHVLYEDGTEEKIAIPDEAQAHNSRVVDEFVDAVLSSRSPAISGRDGYASLRVILAAVNASREGRRVTL